MRIVHKTLAVAALVVATSACGDVIRQGRSPVYLVISTLQGAQGNHASLLGSGLLSDVITNVTTPSPCSDTNPCPTVFNDIGEVALRISLKDIGVGTLATSPTTNNEVTITRYHVTYRQADGRNARQRRCPCGFDGGDDRCIGHRYPHAGIPRWYNVQKLNRRSCSSLTARTSSRRSPTSPFTARTRSVTKSA
jgi:hypothetical protein